MPPFFSASQYRLLPTKAAVLTELSIVLAARGFGHEAASGEKRAIEVYRQKGNLAALAMFNA